MNNKPDIKVEFLGDASEEGKKFLTLLRKNIRISYKNEVSEPMVYDMVARNNPDASAVVPWENIDGIYYIYLRSCIRPAVCYRFPDEGIMWEIPAGVIDPGETPEEAGIRELKEEMGFDLPMSKLEELGPYYFSSVGNQGERIYLYSANVKGLSRTKPESDGSILERHEKIIKISFEEAYRMINSGEIKDSKTILAIYRVLQIMNFNM